MWDTHRLAYHATLNLHFTRRQASNHPSADVRLSADEVMAIVRDESAIFGALSRWINQGLLF